MTDDTFEHVPFTGCACCLCLAAADEMHAVANDHGDAAREHIDGAWDLARDGADGDLGTDSPLPWDRDWQPARCDDRSAAAEVA